MTNMKENSYTNDQTERNIANRVVENLGTAEVKATGLAFCTSFMDSTSRSLPIQLNNQIGGRSVYPPATRRRNDVRRTQRAHELHQL